MTANLQEKLSFDVSKVTAKDMDGFFKAARENDNEKLSAFFAKVVISCPADWGKPDDPTTFINLPYFSAFKDVMKAFVEEVSGKN